MTLEIDSEEVAAHKRAHAYHMAVMRQLRYLERRKLAGFCTTSGCKTKAATYCDLCRVKRTAYQKAKREARRNGTG